MHMFFVRMTQASATTIRPVLVLGLALGLVLAALACPTHASGREPSEIVCLHSSGGEHYKALCRLLLSHLERQNGGDYRWVSADHLPGAAELTGSMDILDAIASSGDDRSKAYIGFSQSDVAFYFRHGGHELYPTPHRKQAQVIAIGRAYPEYLHLFEQGPAPSGSLDLNGRLRHWKHIYLGALGSGTLITSLNVLSILGGGAAGIERHGAISHQSFFWDGESLRSGEADPWAGSLVAGVGHSAIVNGIANDGGRLVSLTPAERRHLRSAFSQFYDTVVVESYGEPAAMVEVPALLVASRRLPREISKSVTDFFATIDQPSGVGLAYLSSLETGASREPAARGLIEQLYQSMRRYSLERQKNLVLSPHRALLERRADRGGWEMLIAVVALGFGAMFGRSLLRTFRRSRSVFDLSPILTGLVTAALCIAWLHICLFLVWRLEMRSYMAYATDDVSPFIRHGYSELFPMVLHYIASAFSAEKLFPIDRFAQLIWLSIPLLIGLSTLASLVHVVVPPALGYLKTRMEREDEMNLEDHVVIVNWHPHAEQVIRQMRTQDRMAGLPDPAIVVVAARADEVSLPLLGPGRASGLPAHNLYGLSPGVEDDAAAGVLQIVGLEGESGDEALLQATAPARARIVIIFPNSLHAEPDSASVLTVLRLQAMLDPERETRLIVWCADARNVEVFRDPRFHLTDVCSTEWTWRVVCQATRVKHVSNIYRHLLTSSAESNEFYEYRLRDECPSIAFCRAQEAIVRFNAEATAPVPGVADVRNTILLVGFVKGTDHSREHLYLNPAADSMLEAGDVLIFLTYVFTPDIAERLGNYLADGALRAASA